MKKLVVLLTVLLASGGCGSGKKQMESKVGKDGVGVFVGDGKYFGLEGDVRKVAGQKSIVFLASETCSTCIEEVETVKEYIVEHGAARNVKLLTLLVNAIGEDALYWKEGLGISWEVGYTDSLDILRSNCPKVMTPCTLVLDSGMRVKFVENGKVDFAEVVRVAGGW